MKHFPGPWRIEGQFLSYTTVFIVAADGQNVAELYPFTDEWTEGEIANARLIAASPQLVETLESARRTLAHCAEDTASGTPSQRLFNAEAARCDAAVAKAGGRS